MAALERARDKTPPSQRLAYDALERAYIKRAGSNELVAEQLAVSRATLYRLLKRGVVAVAGELAEQGES